MIFFMDPPFFLNTIDLDLIFGLAGLRMNSEIQSLCTENQKPILQHLSTHSKKEDSLTISTQRKAYSF
jgi:hypothetical protein